MYKSLSKLPDAYQEVEWIWWSTPSWSTSASTTSPYIDTWYIASSNAWILMEMLHTATRDNAQFIYIDVNWWERWWITAYPSWNWCPQWVTWHQTNVAYNINQWYKIWLNYNNSWECTIDGTNIYTLSWSPNPNKNIVIWNLSYYNLWYKIKSAKISDWTTLVRDLVPCYRKSDGEIWLYDLVGKQFYTNAGTGTFTKWSDVN